MRGIPVTTPSAPYPATTFTTDIAGFGDLDNPDQMIVRRETHAAVVDAFSTGGLWEKCEHEDRGDGNLIIVPAEIPKTVILGPILDTLSQNISAVSGIIPGWPLQLRIAAHPGEIHHDGVGFVSTDVNHCFRLLNSHPLREAVAGSSASVACLISDPLYQSIGRHRYPELIGRGFHQVIVREKETTAAAWLHIPGDNATAMAVSRLFSADSDPLSGVSVSVGGDLQGGSTMIAGRDLIGTPEPRPRRRFRWI